MPLIFIEDYLKPTLHTVIILALLHLSNQQQQQPPPTALLIYRVPKVSAQGLYNDYGLCYWYLPIQVLMNVISRDCGMS